MIEELVLATRNPDKATELMTLLSDLSIRVRTLSDFPDAPEVIEDGDTCRANAAKKATEIARYTGRLAVADDTGLEVEALGGRPGPYAARYAGEQATYEDNWRKLLGELDGVPWPARRARFITVAAIAKPGEPAQLVEGVLEGVITEKASGQHGFGYDPVFFVPELGKTLAELPRDVKNSISHRGQAFRKAKAVLERIKAQH
jgi:XTP/dITP diphosphohydrolase